MGNVENVGAALVAAHVNCLLNLKYALSMGGHKGGPYIFCIITSKYSKVYFFDAVLFVYQQH